MIRSVLIGLKPSSTQAYVIEYGVGLAARLRAELAACTVIDTELIAPPAAVPIGGGAFKKQRDEKLLADARQAGEQLASACESAATGRGVACRATIADGDVAATLAQMVQEHDLLVVGHSPGDPTGSDSLLHRILRGSPRPAIVFPKQRVTSEDVLVAYDGSVQAARTLASFAQSGLGEGRRVHVVSSREDRDVAAAQCETAGRYLARHGLTAEMHAADGTPAETVLSLAGRLQVGLLVMGAFGQASVCEFFFGSTAREILHRLPLPVFVDH